MGFIGATEAAPRFKTFLEDRWFGFPEFRPGVVNPRFVEKQPQDLRLLKPHQTRLATLGVAAAFL